MATAMLKTSYVPKPPHRLFFFFFYKHGIQTLVHGWQKCITDSGDNDEKQMFFLLRTRSISVIALFESAVVSMEKGGSINVRETYVRKKERTLKQFPPTFLKMLV